MVGGEHAGREVRRLESECKWKGTGLGDLERTEVTMSWVVEEGTHLSARCGTRDGFVLLRPGTN